MEVPERTVITCDGERMRSSSMGWMSPRISFSDFLRFDDEVSIQKSKRDDELGENEDCSSRDFDFGIAKSVLSNLLPSETVLTADELFCAGKMRSLGSECGLLRLASYEDDQDGPFSVRQLINDEALRCYSSMDFENSTVTTPRCDTGFNNCGSSSFSLHSTTPTKSYKYSKKFMDFFRPRIFHAKTAWKEAPSSSVTREPSVCPGCNLLISAKTIWQSSKNNSSGEGRSITMPLIAPTKRNDSINKSKIPTLSPTPPRRSDSAVENMTTCTSVSSASAIETSCCSRPQRLQGRNHPFPAEGDSTARLLPKVARNVCNKFCCPSDCFQKIPHRTAHSRTSASECSVTSPYSTLRAPALSLESHNTSFLYINETVDINMDIKESVKQSDDAKDMTRNAFARLGSAQLLQEYENTGRIQRTGFSRPSNTFNGGIPGRKHSSCSSSARGTPSKIARRNLERGNAGPNIDGRPHDLRRRRRGFWMGSNGLSSYSEGVKETTVLNVSVCAFPFRRSGKSSKNRLLRSRTFFSKMSSIK